MSVDRIHVCLQVDGQRFALKATVVVRLPDGDESMIPYVGDCHPYTKRRYATTDEAMEAARQLVQDIIAFHKQDFRRRLAQIWEEWPFDILVIEPWTDVPDDHAEAYAVEKVCRDGVEWYPCCSARPVAEGVACVEGDRFHQVFPLAPIAPSEDWNTDGDVKADKLTGGGE